MWVLTPSLLTSAASASDTDLAGQLWLLTPAPPVSTATYRVAVTGSVRAAVWCAGVWALVDEVSTESSVVLEVAMFL